MQNKIKKYHYSQEDISNALAGAGLTKGDCIFIHSNLGFFGILKEASSPVEYYQIFKAVILDIIGPEGTLIVPAFSYSYCHQEVFSPDITPGVGGFFAERLRQDAASIRSLDANFSIAAIGRYAQYFTGSPPEHSFGDNCFWERFLKANGKFINFNFDAGSTFIHYVEKKMNVPYRYDKAFFGISLIAGRKQAGIFYHFVYDLKKPDNGPDFTKFDKKAKESGLAKIVNLGKGQIVSITARDTYRLIESELQFNPTFLIKRE